MNKKRILKIASLIREQPQHFNMDYYFSSASPGLPAGEAIHTCGSVACIAGWAFVQAAPKVVPPRPRVDLRHGPPIPRSDP